MSEQTGRVNQSQLIATFIDYDQPTAPYEGDAIQISLCGDVLFIYHGKLTEEKQRSTFEHGDNAIGVDAQEFYETLGAILRRGDRHNHDRAVEGTLKADDPAWTVTPVMSHVPGTRRRA